jgi:hypothetical protein
LLESGQVDKITEKSIDELKDIYIIYSFKVLKVYLIGAMNYYGKLSAS